jgi:hypothetical protein
MAMHDSFSGSEGSSKSLKNCTQNLRRALWSRRIWAGLREAKSSMEHGRAMTIRATIFSFVLLFPLPLFAQGSNDIIVMKNGDKFTCEIKGLSTGVLSVKLSYVDGTIAVQWSQIARLESNRLFLVQTESGAVYTGKLSTMGGSDDPPITIQVAAAPKREVEVAQRQIVSLSQTSESFWQRFDGAINTGILYSKGNESIQYNLSSQVAYQRERWSSQGSFNSTFASSSGSDLSTRNQIDLNNLRLLRWNNWFYAGSTSFLQSSVQEINLQTTLGGGVGRYIKHSNRASIYVLGGFAWQNTAYKQHTADQGTQNTAVGFVTTQVKAFKFKKTNVDLTATVLPAISEPGRVHFNTNAAYYIKVASDLSWNFSFYGSWDSRPPATLRGSDYGTSSGLSWTFGNR